MYFPLIHIQVYAMLKDRIKKSFVAYIIEQSLYDIGGSNMVNKTNNALQKVYGATITDCYEHPEYLQQSLYDLYGNSSNEIIKIIHSRLEEYDYQEPISNFLKGMCP